MKVLIMAGYTPSLVNFRGDLIKDIVQRGHEVIAAGPETGYEQEIAELGARFVHLQFERTGTNPFKDIALISRIRKLIKAEKPDIVFSYTIKPIIYGSIAARLAGVKKIFSMVTGLGSVFTASGAKGVFIRSISKVLYYIAFTCCDHVFFQNPDDINEFVKIGLIREEKCALVNGSGVNLDKFHPTPLPEEPVFLMICRIIKDKGVIEFLEAARRVKKKYPNARFQLLGPFDVNPSALKYEDIKPYVEDGSIEYLGKTKDVRPYIANCFTYVLPSYREGTPRSVLEAMAMARPVITTNTPGCRETVIDGLNGFLIPVKNVDALAEKMAWMIENRQQAAQMAQESLRICQEKYDVRKVNGYIIEVLGL